MTISEWDPSNAGRLTKAYNAQAVEIPYDDYPVDPETLVDALSLPNPDFSDGRLFVSEHGGGPKGFIHVGNLPGDGDSEERQGLIRYLCFPRDRRDVGQALLDSAHEYLGPLASSCRAFDHRFAYSCMSHPCLKSPWEHVHALLGSNGYESAGGTGGVLVMVLRDYEMPKPALPYHDVDVRVGDDPLLPDLISHGDLPTVAVQLFRGDKWLGGNETRPHYLPHWDRELQYTCMTTGMGVTDTERGRGFGRYLMERSLYEMQRAGCQHAILGTDHDNYTALSLYASLGYRTCYRFFEMTRP